MESLCDEIIMQIFSKVRTIDLAHVRCVCKRWKKILEEPLWHKLHCSYSISNPHNKVLMIQRRKKLCFVDLTYQSTTSQAKLGVCIPRLQRTYKIIGSCNGFLCLYDEMFRKIRFKNPFVDGKMHLLPQLASRYHILACAFGYDSTTNSYSVIAIVSLREIEGFNPNPQFSQVMVCKCEKSMKWRNIGETSYHLWNKHPLQASVHDGRFHFHWISWYNTIASFDLTDGKLEYIVLPDSLILSKDCDLIVFQNCPCLVKKYQRYETVHLQIWMMKEYRSRSDSWVKEVDTESLGVCLKLPLQNCSDSLSLKVIGEVGSGKIVIYCNSSNLKGILLYEPLNNHNYKFLEFQDLPKYQQSLASIHIPTLGRMPWIHQFNRRSSHRRTA